jgi:hypothetical protein
VGGPLSLQAKRGNPQKATHLDGDCGACPRAIDPRVASLLAMTVGFAMTVEPEMTARRGPSREASYAIGLFATPCVAPALHYT